ncbi:MAG: cytochrome c oxidase subunit 3 [Alphaproteobacteria bacterium]|nr:MAG: cytochrome c oxidase subunit 3 [Alphaproteobacteria bacterium]
MATTTHAPGHAGDAHAQKHPYHLVDPSPWPLISALSGGVLAVGAVMYMHKSGPWLMVVGLLAVVACMYMWWRDVVREAKKGYHNPVVNIGLRYGMALFIASEVMFFLAFFWAYFHSALFPQPATGGVWPPKGVVTFDPFHLPFLGTLILLLSGCTVTWAHHALLEKDRKGLIQGLALTVALGFIFTLLQAYEYGHAAFGFRDGIYSSTFYMATGFHGFHVIVGTIFLAVCLVRAMRGDFTPEKHVGFESAAWYWHFVDVVWLFLFVSIYWWGAGHSAGH